MPVGDETIRNVNLVPMTDPLLGAVVEQYRIESLIGSGAMGIVYRAVHQVIGKTVAIKVLKPDFADDPEMVQRLVREARTVNAIRHPAIVDIFGFGTLPRTEQPYIVMDLLDGQPLDEYIKAHAPMKVKDVAPFLDELLSALSAAHAVGVIHRDLKPGNVFVESKPDGQRGIKVIDFGLAKQADRAGGSVRPTNPGTLLGTPAFMAPEQVLGTRVTPATDLYAVGGIAYQMLTNHLPHEAPSAIEVLSQKMQHDPIRPKQWQPAIDDEMDAWVMKLLAREPEQRTQDADEARRALRRIVDGRTSSGSGLRQAIARPTATGVVPKREWGDAKTLITEPSAGPASETGKAADASTDRGTVSPWAQTNLEHPVQDGSEPTAPPLRSPFQSARGELPTQAVDPQEVVRSQAPAGPTKRSGLHAKPASQPSLPPVKSGSQPTLPGVKGSQPTLPPVELSRPGEETRLVQPPSRLPLYLALATTILALLVGLAWLFSQRS
ncbi:MAG: protein kinase domain-containing protein [Myxococcota bacterium]